MQEPPPSGPQPPPLPVPSPASRRAAPSLWRLTVDAHDDLDEGETRERRGIGGWLLLFTVGRVLAIPMLGFALLLDVVAVTTPSIWLKLTSPDSASYDPLWSKILIYETAGNTLWLLYSVLILILLFSQRKVLRPLMVAYMVGLTLFYWGDYLVALRMTHFSAGGLDRLLGNGIAATINALIWIPYWLVSGRVKGTLYR